jgi:hypothetical protein
MLVPKKRDFWTLFKNFLVAKFIKFKLDRLSQEDMAQAQEKIKRAVWLRENQI